MNILILGGAVSGEAAAHLGRKLGYHIEVYDRRAAAVGQLRDDAFVVHSGTWSLEHLRGKDLVVASPGFPEHARPVVDALASGIPLVSELEFAATYTEAPIIAVTGTNGKTTVTGLVAEMLAASGIRAIAAGNIGTALSAVALEECDRLVVEASSFQLRFIAEFAPVAAAIVNVAPDHLDWHGDFEAYAAAKARIFENQGPNALLVFDADDPGAAGLAHEAPGRVAAVSAIGVSKDGVGVRDGSIVIGDMTVTAPDVGAAFLVDLAIAGVLALDQGASEEAVSAVIAGFGPGPHRRQTVGEWAGVTWVDDSKATNPHAAIASVGSYPSVVLIAGGRNKGLDLTPLVTHPSVKSVIAIGESAGEIVSVAGGRVAATLEDAVLIADEIAEPGDTVLLAPGCASFDMFANYGARGDAFADAVHRMKEDSPWPGG